MKRVNEIRSSFEEKWNADDSWIENNSIWFKKEVENGDILVEIKETEYFFHVSFFWKSPMADERTGMISMLHKQTTKNLNVDDLTKWSEEVDLKIESLMKTNISLISKNQK